MNKIFKRSFCLLFLCITFLCSGCSLLENNTEYQKEKERCIVNKNDISRFSYGGNEYAILDDTYESSDIGEWVGYIRKLIVIDEQGNALEQIDYDSDALEDMEVISQKYTEEELFEHLYYRLWLWFFKRGIGTRKRTLLYGRPKQKF